MEASLLMLNFYNLEESSNHKLRMGYDIDDHISIYLTVNHSNSVHITIEDVYSYETLLHEAFLPLMYFTLDRLFYHIKEASNEEKVNKLNIPWMPKGQEINLRGHI